MAFDLVSLGLVCADVMVRPVDAYPERGKLSLVPHLELHVGGLAGVAATVFSQLGGRAAFIGKVGADGFGDYVLQTMRSAGVCCDHAIRSAGRATSATVVLVSEDGERTFIHHPGASEDFVEEEVDLGVIAEAKWLHWGGPAVTPKLDGAPIARILERARCAGLGTSMDTCYDGRGIWLERIEQALPHLRVVMTSLEEARMYTGRLDPEAIADFFLERGTEVTVVKLGADGLLVKRGGNAHHVVAHRAAPVVDTTGAGDACCAGFLFAFMNGWELNRCALLANAVGGLTVQTMGGAEAIARLSSEHRRALARLCTREEAEALVTHALVEGA